MGDSMLLLVEGEKGVIAANDGCWLYLVVPCRLKI